MPCQHLTLIGRCAFIAIGLWGVGAAPPLPGGDVNLFTKFTDQGLAFTNDVHVKLPPPTLARDVTGDTRQAALHQLSGKQAWDRFVRDSIMAPITVTIEAVVDSHGERLGLAVHSAFVVHADLAQLSDAQAMEEIFGSPADAQQAAGVVTQELSADELRGRGFTAQAESPATFAYIELPLLNKVLVRGVIRLEKRERPGAIEFVWQLDPSFNTLEQYASRWTKLERNAVGKLIQGESFPYESCGGFMGAYEVGPTTKPLLIESRLLLREPQEWFAGSHFLRSKIPSLMQENARSFRRKLTSH